MIRKYRKVKFLSPEELAKIDHELIDKATEEFIENGGKITKLKTDLTNYDGIVAKNFPSYLTY